MPFKVAKSNAIKQVLIALLIGLPFYRSKRRSTRFRLLPTFLIAFFTAAFDLRDFFASYLTS
jgi:hypothetical protein